MSSMSLMDNTSGAEVGAAKDFLIYVNGRLIPEGEAAVSAYDSGLNFGDGVFEGIRVYNGRVLRLDQHLQRLYESANALAITVNLTQDQLRAAILFWLRANGVQTDFHFRPIVTRGIRFPPRVDPRFCTGPTTVLLVGAPVQPAPAAGIRAIIASVRRTPPEALDPKIKSLGYGNNILAKLEAIRQGVDEALMLDTHGFLAEASATNVFVVRGGRLLTPWPKACLEGITRGIVMELARARGYQVVERDISPTEIVNAQEIFLAGTGAEITPIVAVNGRPIGSGEPGPITREVAAAYGELVRAEGTPIGEVE